ncbi:Abi-alpha family protein [Bradyrhizobium sp. BEA-2-5]|uniref:Abi-alpha family protein n=1 Tax=Bradyrhizobium sp. BEA-2-5 TaxID=3080015 RepID=UPI00293F282D|nr:Abi-alpha family protein [Bradyrhizobium sp. BEA-2-5]WOH78268.1 Abi-alpha family protein [Bradyrhizobium sp. BEA-2-5]
MTDDRSKMPYEEAITEGAKAVNNTVDLVREGGRAVGPAIGNIYGLLIGDSIAAARQRRLDAITRKTEKILRDRNINERVEAPESIAIPLLEAAQGEPREEMQELWARLLANALDPGRAHDVRPEFIETLKKLHPLDAAILQRTNNEEEGSIGDFDTAGALGVRVSAVRASFNFLYEIKCGEKFSGSHPNGASFGLSPFGQEFMIALNP